MNKKVRKAVIAAAGMGTRFLPQTKAMPKEMLPIIDRPVIQLVVESAVQAGIEDIIIVTGPTKRAIEDHFDRSVEFEADLRLKGKNKEADTIKAIAELANFIYIRQKGDVKGNAVPVINAEHMIGDEPFMYFFADDFYTGDVSYAKQILDVYEKTGKSVVCLREISDEDTNRYGVVGVKENLGDGLYIIDGYYEKPGPENAPSRLACVCGYVLAPSIMKHLSMDNVSPRGEVEMAAAIDALSREEDVYGLVIQGEYHDTGSPELYLQTLVDIALNDESYGERFRQYLKDKI
ncbi:UTP--glucose-1-phosphate uridylyltransferase [Candidatus Saccharibacteria bacterium]|nr:UTP--glucose-1-phosphate uridylyltransferase [Candidatus Saccharibacteria bacterium]